MCHWLVYYSPVPQIRLLFRREFCKERLHVNEVEFDIRGD